MAKALKTVPGPNGCIEYGGHRDRWGYGVARRESKLWKAHRWAWREKHGAIPKGVLVLHRCDNPPCVNTDHLFLGTHQDNRTDSISKGRSRSGEHQRSRTHCPQGHEYTPENTYVSKEGWRQCRTCRTARNNEQVASGKHRDYMREYMRSKRQALT